MEKADDVYAQNVFKSYWVAIEHARDEAPTVRDDAIAQLIYVKFSEIMPLL